MRINTIFLKVKCDKLKMHTVISRKLKLKQRKLANQPVIKIWNTNIINPKADRKEKKGGRQRSDETNWNQIAKFIVRFDTHAHTHTHTFIFKHR